MNDIISSDLESDLKNSWRTDPCIFKALDNEFHFTLDASASKENHKCDNFLTKEDDALIVDWSEHTYGNNSVFINPPYGRGFIKKFMKKCIEQAEKGLTSVMLVPATLDAQWLPIDDISEIRIITGGRLSFFHPVTNKKINGNTKGTMFVIFRPTKMPLSVRLIDRDELLAHGAVENE